MHPWYLSYVAYEYWCNTNVGASADVECCCGFMTKLNVGTASIQIWLLLMSGYSAMHPRCLSYVASKYWCNTNVGASADVECCCGFMAKMSISMASVQILLHDKYERWHGFSANMASWQRWSVVVASWQRWTLAWLQCKYCSIQIWTLARLWCKYGFMAKMKCCCGFVTKMNVGMASMQILLHAKDECWRSFSTRTNAGTTSLKKTLDATLLQRLLTWPRCKDS